ncbi:hypothetical protein [Rothia kristinae]|uniref:Uncharacterized protein n=1 Tax=Rothia kristinae TaxID=37923 RepID=A0A7T3CH24_9MICC|nr:hypothetical protein [Rothia kristinae]QPT54037.1 hypothetical protein I6G21_02195 [Rothia kristinae]
MSSTSPMTPPVRAASPSAAVRLCTGAALPMAVLTGLWITAGRALFGAGGLLVGVFAVTVLPVYLAVLGLACWHLLRDARRRPGGATTPAIAGALACTWVLALIFGFLVPDRVEGQVVSAASAVLGPDVVGLSAGFGNTFGILTFVAAFATLGLAITQNRRGRRAAEGRPATEDEILDAAGYDGGRLG